MATSTIKMPVPPTKTLVSSSSGIAPVGDSGSNNITFASDPKQYSLFTFKLSNGAMRGYASWVSDTEIRGSLVWVTDTPNNFLGIIIIKNISGTTGKLTHLQYYNKNTNTIMPDVKLADLIGIGLA